MTLQRYRINNCADIKDDKGGYCLSEDVAELESSKWVSVNTMTPKDEDEEVLTIDAGGRREVYAYHKELWSSWLVTHWQPLPAPPA